MELWFTNVMQSEVNLGLQSWKPWFSFPSVEGNMPSADTSRSCKRIGWASRATFQFQPPWHAGAPHQAVLVLWQLWSMADKVQAISGISTPCEGNDEKYYGIRNPSHTLLNGKTSFEPWSSLVLVPVSIEKVKVRMFRNMNRKYSILW